MPPYFKTCCCCCCTVVTINTTQLPLVLASCQVIISLFVALNYPSEQTGFQMKPHQRQHNDPLRYLLHCESHNLRQNTVVRRDVRFVGWTDAKKKKRHSHGRRLSVKSVACIMDQHTHTHTVAHTNAAVSVL